MSEDGLDLSCFVSCSFARSCLLQGLMVEVVVVVVVVVVFIVVVFVVVVAGNVEMLGTGGLLIFMLNVCLMVITGKHWRQQSAQGRQRTEYLGR